MKLGATLLVTVTLVLAGCIAAPEEIDTASAIVDSDLLASLGAIPLPKSTADQVIVLRTDAGPEGGLTSFWWEIPEGVILEGDDGEDSSIEFLAAPVLLEDERAPLERWIALGFLVEEGELYLSQIAMGAPMTVSAHSVLDGMNEEIERSIEPFVFGARGDLKVGDRIGFVVGGVAAEDVELALVLKPLAQKWDHDEEEVPESTEDFLALLGESPRIALPEVATGNMHQVALLLEGGSSFGGISVSMGPIEREGEVTNLGAAELRQQTIFTGFDSAGFGMSLAGYDSRSALGSWSAVANAHGIMSEGRGELIPLVGPFVGGYAFVAAMGEGDDVGATSLTLDTTNAGLLGDGMFLMEIDIDQTLTDLLGLPAASKEGSGEGGSVEQRSDGLFLDVGGVRMLAVGLSGVRA